MTRKNPTSEGIGSIVTDPGPTITASQASSRRSSVATTVQTDEECVIGLPESKQVSRATSPAGSVSEDEDYSDEFELDLKSYSEDENDPLVEVELIKGKDGFYTMNLIDPKENLTREAETIKASREILPKQFKASKPPLGGASYNKHFTRK